MTTQIGSQLLVDFEVVLPLAHLQVVRLDHDHDHDNHFQRDGVYWIDLCLTPRRPHTHARFADTWSTHRFTELGSIIAFPPGKRVHLKSRRGKHASIICQLQAAAVDRWLPDDFAWTDRRLEACLHLASDRIRSLLLWLYQELRRSDGEQEMYQAILTQLSIELARYIMSANEPIEKGGLASWRLRLIDVRLAEDGNPPTLGELAHLCKLSVRQLTRGFRTSRGCSIGSHLAQLRIDVAKRRLATGEPIRQIAASMGFASQSGFTSAFRKATGTTPDQYRKSLGSELRKPLRSEKSTVWPHSP